MPRRRGLLSNLLGGRRGFGRGRGSRRDKRDSSAESCSNNACCRRDTEECPPALRFRPEACHGMEATRELLSRAKSGKYRETGEERRMRRMWEKQQQAMGVNKIRQTKSSMLYAKRQILDSTSTTDLLERADNLIEEDWLGKIEEMPGSMYFIGAFGDLTHGTVLAWTSESLKNRARLFGCIVVCIIQLIGPPAVFFSTIFGWGIRSSANYKWEHWDPTDLEGCLYDWRHVKLTKTLGILFQLCFILNGLFVVLDGKQAFFKIYNMFQYLKRSTPNFDMRGHRFLYMGAFIDCWTVLWCCVSSYVIVGASNSPKDILFDSLGLLFVYNLDDISGDLGFVNEDDWPGLRLGWIHAEMVKKDWSPGDEEEPGEVVEGPPPCVKGCGRPVAPGLRPNGQPFDTCCRGCANGEAHDEECQQATADREGPGGEGPTQEYAGGETTDWDIGGWVSYYWYHFTAAVLSFMTVFVPLLAVFTPFLKIVPEDG